jgi:hypothetical protein
MVDILNEEHKKFRKIKKKKHAKRSKKNVFKPQNSTY